LINTQALLGTLVGNCVLQELIGHGEIGAVFLAERARSRRRVAVKILSPDTSMASSASQTSDQQAVFLKRFLQEVAAATSLKHENILSLHENGVHDGLAYLVIPYMDSGTLQNVMEREGPLALPQAATYLDQLAAALDYAHEQGIVHQDIKPTNILMTSEGHLLLADFGLGKMAAEKQAAQMPLLQSVLPVGSLEYLAPEQVTGDAVDAHTDLYSLGVILYQMVTGKTPFQGETAVQVLTQLVQASPPSPRLLRTDLPVAAEQVILRAMAKRPSDRYARAQDFASAFRVALTAAGTLPDGPGCEVPASDSTASSRLFAPRPRGLFDPIWQKAEGEAALLENGQGKKEPVASLPAARNTSLPSPRRRLGLKTGLLRPVDGTETSLAGATTSNGAARASTGELPLTPAVPPAAPDPVSPFPAAKVTRTLSVSQSEPGNPGEALSTAKQAVPNPLSPFPAMPVTGTLATPISEPGNTGTIKLTGAVKVVQVPVAGQPGRYVTGLLPLAPQTPQAQLPQGPLAAISSGAKKIELKKWQKITALALVILLVLSVVSMSLFSHPNPNPRSKNGVPAEHVKPDLQAISAAQATATTTANTILIDPLNQNIHNWPVASTNNKLYVFKDGAYHITDNDPNQSAPAILADVNLKGPMAYTLTMDEIKGDDASVNNSFGMILRFNSQVQGGRNIITFYSFEVVNTHDGEYQFWKYDNSKGPAVNPWKSIWDMKFSNEFHQGQGPKNSNTFKIVTNDKYFTLSVNGKKIGTAEDSSLTGGEIGMIVNLKGTEVAFSDLKLTYN
jgi:serine/threonine protein kinase